MELVKNEAVHLLADLFELVLTGLEVSENVYALVDLSEARDLVRQELVEHLCVLAVLAFLDLAHGLHVFVGEDAEVAVPLDYLFEEILI